MGYRMSIEKRYNAAIAASLLSSNVFMCAPIGGALRPLAPVTAPPMMIKPTPEVARSSHAWHRQNKLVCDTFSVVNFVAYVLLAQWHNQKSTYHTHAHARTRVNSFILLISKFDYLKKCLCHCARSILTGLCICSTCMFLIVSYVPRGFYGI